MGEATIVSSGLFDAVVFCDAPEFHRVEDPVSAARTPLFCRRCPDGI
jgi:hypothetical protein